MKRSVFTDSKKLPIFQVYNLIDGIHMYEFNSQAHFRLRHESNAIMLTTLDNNIANATGFWFEAFPEEKPGWNFMDKKNIMH